MFENHFVLIREKNGMIMIQGVTRTMKVGEYFKMSSSIIC